MQHGAVGTDDERQAAALGCVAGDQIARFVLARRVQQMMRIAVAAEKALQPDHIRRSRGPDQHRAARAGLDQADATQDEGAHDALAQLGFGDQQRANLVGRDQQGLDFAFRHAIDQGRAVGELTDLGHELAWPLLGDGRYMADAVALRDRDMARQNHEHAGGGLARLEQFLAVGIAAQRSKTAQALDFLRAQGRECVIARAARRAGRGRRRFLRVRQIRRHRPSPKNPSRSSNVQRRRISYGETRQAPSGGPAIVGADGSSNGLALTLMMQSTGEGSSEIF